MTGDHPFPKKFFILAFNFTWIAWLPGLLNAFGILALPAPWEVFFTLGIFGPLAAAVVASFGEGGTPEAVALVKRGFDLNFPRRWLLPALLLPLSISGTAMLIFWLLGGTPPPLLVVAQPWTAIPVFLLMFFIGGGPEEFGWRGYALDRLQSRWGALNASIILGFIWGFWHLPLFFIPGTGQYYMPFWVFLLVSPAMSILATWIYNNTGHSLLAAWLFHAAINTGMEIFPVIQKQEGGDQRLFLITVVLYLLIASMVIFLYSPKTLAHTRSNSISG